MKIIDKKHEGYDNIVKLLDSDNYKIDTTKLHEEEEIICPTDNTMKVCKKDGKIYIKKTSRLYPF